METLQNVFEVEDKANVGLDQLSTGLSLMVKQTELIAFTFILGEAFQQFEPRVHYEWKIFTQQVFPH
jgi:hypothetical protein